MPQPAGSPQPKAWELTGDAKRETVRSMFGEIAPRYDRINGLMSLSLHHRWRRQAVATLQLQPGDSVLDLCCGTGDFFPPLRAAVGAEGTVIGLDFSEPMLQVAARKQVPGQLLVGDATDLSFGNQEFDAVTVGWGIRNVPDIDRAHQEAFRVLKPGGRFVSLDTAVPEGALIRSVSRFVLGLVPALGKIFGHGWHYAYLKESTALFKSREALAESMRQAGFVDVRWRNLMFGNLCMHWGQRPLEVAAQQEMGGSK
jgi:demethylmenaquinone methyltransferase/2-methoxy-6-polyprenyl-1,4-benzoquinol methylase